MDMFLQVGAVSGAVITILTLSAMMIKTIRLLNRIVDEVVGTSGVPSLSDRVATLSAKLDEHMDTWHAGRPSVRTNGGRSR